MIKLHQVGCATSFAAVPSRGLVWGQGALSSGGRAGEGGVWAWQGGGQEGIGLLPL